MMLNLRWTKRAIARLDSIAAYIARDNPVRAKTFVQELRTKIENLRSFQLGTAGRVFGTKEYVLHSNYIVVYRVKDTEVQILTILHTARDFSLE